MRIRLVLELRIEGRRPSIPEPEQQFEHRDNDSLVENTGHPRYVGFRPDPIDPEERRA